MTPDTHIHTLSVPSVTDLCVRVQAPKWGSLEEWPLSLDHDRNSQIKFVSDFYATEMPMPLPSKIAEIK